jgi:hypothetical protein
MKVNIEVKIDEIPESCEQCKFALLRDTPVMIHKTIRCLLTENTIQKNRYYIVGEGNSIKEHIKLRMKCPFNKSK